MEQRGELFTAILDYSENGAIPSFTGELRMAFAFIRSSLDRNAVAWEETRKKRAEAGRLGGLAKVANAKRAKQSLATVANLAVNVPVSVNETNTTKSASDKLNGGPSVLTGLSEISPDTKIAPWAERRGRC